LHHAGDGGDGGGVSNFFLYKMHNMADADLARFTDRYPLAAMTPPPLDGPEMHIVVHPSSPDIDYPGRVNSEFQYEMCRLLGLQNSILIGHHKYPWKTTEDSRVLFSDTTSIDNIHCGGFLPFEELTRLRDLVAGKRIVIHGAHARACVYHILQQLIGLYVGKFIPSIYSSDLISVVRPWQRRSQLIRRIQQDLLEPSKAINHNIQLDTVFDDTSSGTITTDAACPLYEGCAINQLQVFQILKDPLKGAA
jgi:hypothetical protein